MDGPLWFLRINPLRRARMADGALRELLAALVVAERGVSDAAAAASDDLFTLIGAATEDAQRRELVALRRAVHRDRDPKPGPVPPSVRTWVAARERRAVLGAAVTEGHGAAAERERAGLAAALADDDVRRALALLAPEVAQEAQRYRAAVAAGPVAAKTRKSERGLVQYVTRAMLRTSPLSRFTAVGLAVEGDDGVPPQDVTPAGATAFGDLDRVMLGHVLGGLDVPADPADAWVAVPPTSHLDVPAGRLFLLRPVGGELRRNAVPVTPAVQRLLDAVAMGPRRAGAVAAELAGTTGGDAYDQALHAVLGAVRAGVLSASGSGEDATSTVPELLAHPHAPEPLRRVRERLPELATGAIADRPTLLEGLAADLADASRAAGRPARVVVEEDYVLPPTVVDPRGWAGPLADLGPATELLSVFDWLHDVRLMMSAAFVDRFGPGADVRLAEHARHLVGEVSRRALVMDAAFRAGGDPPAGTGPADGSLERLQAVRRQVTHDVHALLDKAAGDTEVVLAPDEALELVAGVPDRVRALPLLYGVLVQPAGGRLVVNDGLPGHGLLYGRFLHADAALGGDARERLAGRLTALLTRDGARLVEDLGLHGLSVNAHARVLPHGLTAEDWYSLRLVHDPESDALRVEDAEGRHLRVLPLGTGHPGLFPPPMSVATGLTMSGRLYSGLVGGWHAGSGRDATATRACPRLRVGDVVVERRRWYGGDELVAAVAAGPGETDRLLALAAWRARHGVPEEVVLKTTPDDEGPLAVGAPEVTANRLAQKPQYVDLSSALGARVLPRMLERRAGAGVGFVEEALPAVGESAHATEWVVEVGRHAGGRFRYGGEL